MASPYHTGGLGTERDEQVTDGDLGHGVCVHMTIISVHHLQLNTVRLEMNKELN